MIVHLANFIEKLQSLERRYGPDLPVELSDGLPACPPVINPVVGRYAVVIHGCSQSTRTAPSEEALRIAYKDGYRAGYDAGEDAGRDAGRREEAEKHRY